MYLWGVVRHEAYVLVLMTYGQGTEAARGLVATLIEEADGWKRTNALSSDETMDLVWSAFRLGGMTARP